MATRRPIVSVAGRRKQLPAGDTIPKMAVPFGGRLYVGALPPDGALPGDGWLSSEDGSFAVLYDDGDSQQWVVNSGPAGSRGPAGDDGADGRDGIDGTDGRSAEFQRGTTHIQWRLVGDATWLNLVALTDIKGDSGTPGDPSTATISIAGQAGTMALPTTGLSYIQNWLQATRNTLVWLVERFNSSGKALQAVAADSATNAVNATNATDSAKWGGGTKTVSTSAPSGGADGDVWFQREA